jgi:hypothetical protein
VLFGACCVVLCCVGCVEGALYRVSLQGCVVLARLCVCVGRADEASYRVSL